MRRHTTVRVSSNEPGGVRLQASNGGIIMLRVIALIALAASLGGCVVAPAPYGYGYAPAYGYYAAPAVNVGIGVGGGWGGGWRR
jgi:hypothetical protein